jgi:O-antigen ligase
MILKAAVLADGSSLYPLVVQGTWRLSATYKIVAELAGGSEMKHQIDQPKGGTTLVMLSSVSFTLVLMLVLCTPFVEMSGRVSTSLSIYRIYAYALAGLLQLAMVFLRGRQRSWRIYATALTPFLIWAALSLLWTQHIDLTGKRLALLTVVYAGIFGGICDLPRQRALSIIRVGLVAALILNFSIVFVAPDVGTHGGSLWRGFMAHKNIAGMLCAFTVIAFAFDGAKIPLALRLAVVACALIFLGFSLSKTALISLPISLAAGGSIAMISERSAGAIAIAQKFLVTASRVLFAIVLLTILVLTVQRDTFLSLTDDTATLTSRGAIWRPMIQFYLDSPLLGAGYGAYWNPSDSLINPAADKGIWKSVDQGHNGYLDLLVQVGLPGLALALYAAFARPLARLATVIGRKPQRAALIFGTLVFSLLENFSESSLLADDSLGNAILLIALAQLHRFISRASERLKDGATEVGMPWAAQLRESRQKQQKRGE